MIKRFFCVGPLSRKPGEIDVTPGSRGIFRYLVTRYLFLTLAGWAIAGPVENCPILQTTDATTPCHLMVDPSAQTNLIPPFVYALNLPERTAEVPCPVVQTLDVKSACYAPPKSRDDPAFVLTVPLPPNADELDESPGGIRKLKSAQKDFQDHSDSRTVTFGQSSPELTQAFFRSQPTVPPVSQLEGTSNQNSQLSSFAESPTTFFTPSLFPNNPPTSILEFNSALAPSPPNQFNSQENEAKPFKSFSPYQKPHETYGLPYLKR